MEIDNRGPPLQVVCYVFGVLASVATLLRCYVRLYLVKSFGVDDYFMALALVRPREEDASYHVDL
jgi:hypothetical protein